MAEVDPPALRRFLAGEVSPAQFSHREHVHMAFALLKRREFARVVPLYARALERITARAGKPEKFNLTITIALLSLVAAALQETPELDFEGFAAAHPSLFDKGTLARWYRPAQLGSALARRAFVLPDPAHAQ